jgi:hypothetical protein
MKNAPKKSISPKINAKALVPTAKLDLISHMRTQNLNVSKLNHSLSSFYYKYSENKVG